VWGYRPARITACDVKVVDEGMPGHENQGL
jgi:hypothetical protein